MQRYKALLLNLGGSTVNEEFDPVDEAGIIGGKEEGDGRDLFRASHLAAWNLGFEELFGVRAERVENWRVDSAWTEDIHADLSLFELYEPGTSVGANRSFAGTINTKRRKSLDAGDGTIEEDRAVVVEERQGLLYGKECAANG